MFEIQPDWPVLDRFYVKFGDQSFNIVRSDGALKCTDESATINCDHNMSFSIQTKGGSCAFISPKRKYDIHNGKSINCIDVTPNGQEILSGDSMGKLYLTYQQTEPVPLLGPTPDFDIEDCLVDPAHKSFFSCGADFAIYEFSSVEYQFTAKMTGHASSVTHIDVVGDLLYSCGRDTMIAQWNLETHKRATSMKLGSPVNDFTFTDKGILIAATDSYLRGLESGTLKSSSAPSCDGSSKIVTVTSCGDNVVGGCDDGTIYLWDLRQPENPKATWKWYDSPINKVRYHDNKLWTMNNDGTAAAIDIENKSFRTILGTTSYAPVRDCAFNGGNIWTADGEGVITLFET